MRLHEDMIKLLKEEIKPLLPGATVYLFSSRVDNHKKGGH